MDASNIGSSKRQTVEFTVQGLGWSRRWLHLTIILLLTAGHTVVHYLILIPGIGEAVEHMPFFNFHVLHEAEYLVAIAYASLVFRLLGGTLALVAFAMASIPFLLASRISPLEYGEYGFTGPGNALIEILVLLIVAVFVVILNELWGRERDRRISLYEELQSTHSQLHTFNQNVQTQLNAILESLAEAESVEQLVNEVPISGSEKDRIVAFMRRLSDLAKPQI